MENTMMADAVAWLERNKKTWSDLRPQIRTHPVYIVGDRIEEDQQVED